MPNYLTFADVAAQTHNNELLAMVQEILHPTTMLNDSAWKQSTDMLRDVGGLRGDPPRGQWVDVDEGVKPNKGDHEKTEEEMGILEAWSEVNEKTMMISPNPDALRWENDSMHMEGMGLDLEEGLIYGNREANPKQFRGFIPRFNVLTDFKGYDGDGNRQPFVTIDAGGAGGTTNNSMLFIVWGKQAANMLYPRFQKNNGIQFKHWDYENITDASGNIKRVARSQFLCSAGLGLANRRAAVRIANIEASLASSDLETYMPKLVSAMYQAFAAVPAAFRSRVKIYTTAEVILALRHFYESRVTAARYVDAIPPNAHGDISFDSFTIRQCDTMKSTEDVLS